MNPHLSHKFEESEEQLVMDQTTEGTVAYLIIYNDDHNTFDWVIQCLMDVCNHTHEQSEQLSLIIHFKGKATVKTGPFDSLKPMKDALLDRGLSAVIETEVESR
ncbi:MAG TPA: ATP-dependent Clp protease adaptor ClpS [Saprospiraceae bacterium]|jgi:ATP-dependent Clp protease adaptor protein ClpS|nr:ATP-dependent Clp protease adaptor ClpS [Saprospiraceae bacterium]HRG20268.1 ATP-dependent Clp protease adaptor ClpS [Saprospiraceae bacterium]